MSKKLIAVASAAALALSALVSTPAHASFTVGMDGGTGAGLTAETATTVNVPTEDAIRFSATEANSTTVKYTVSTTTATGTVNVTTTGAVKVLSDAELTAKTTAETNDHKSGASSLSVAASGSSAIIHVYTTSTTAGTVTISNAGNSVTYFVKGIAGKAYNVTATGPSIASKGVTYKFSATVVDMYGNPIATGLTVTTNGFVVDNLGAFTAAPTLAAGTNGTKGVWNFEATVGGSGNGLLSVGVGGTAAVAADLAGFPVRSLTATIAVGSADPAATIASLQSQVAALTTQVAAMVTKKRFNKLARKWNAAFPSQKVALKK
jgi:hypothetical protein